jgi:endonuclease III
MKSAPRLPQSATRQLARLAEQLHRAYGAPEPELGNKSDPLDEAIYITLTLQTDLARAALMWANLKAAFPTWEDLAVARTARVAAVIREGGLHRQKARTIKRLLAAVKKHAGEYSLRLLCRLPDADGEDLLVRLPGFSWKTARCVLLYSLDRDVFPVDSNTFRVLKRAGILPASAVYRRRSLHDALQAAVPAANRRAFHVNLIVHGQRTCLPQAPHCAGCVARALCPMRGVPLSARAKPALHSFFARAS